MCSLKGSSKNPAEPKHSEFGTLQNHHMPSFKHIMLYRNELNGSVVNAVPLFPLFFTLYATINETEVKIIQYSKL